MENQHFYGKTHYFYGHLGMMGPQCFGTSSPRMIWNDVIHFTHTLPRLTSPRYEYDGEEYVWPFVDEVRHEYVSVPEAHLDVMRVLLSEFSGICCLGYKLRRDGTICGSVTGKGVQES